MKIPFGLMRLVGWTGRCVAALVALAICSSAFADTSKNVVVPREKMTRAQTTTTHRVMTPRREVYILLTGSAIPQPIDRVTGLIATTTIPMTCIGNHFGQ